MTNDNPSGIVCLALILTDGSFFMNTKEFIELSMLTGKLDALTKLILTQCEDDAIKDVVGKHLSTLVDELVTFRETNLEVENKS